MSVEVVTAILLKSIGAFAGAVLALLFVPPKTIKGFIRRGVAALISGPIFGPYVQSYAGFADDWQGILAAACLAGFASWWIMGNIVKLAQSWQTKGLADED